MLAILLSALPQEFGKFTSVVAERWITASLAYAAALRAYDGWLYPTDPANQAAAERLHEAWRCWVDDAEVVLHETELLTENGEEIPGLDELRNLALLTRATLRMTPALIIQRYQQVQRGEVYSIEEVRRELRAGSCR